jgi:hypothetical protein
MTGSADGPAMTALNLPTPRGEIGSYRLGAHPTVIPIPGPWSTRELFAPAHVVANPLGDPLGSDADRAGLIADPE